MYPACTTTERRNLSITTGFFFGFRGDSPEIHAAYFDYLDIRMAPSYKYGLNGTTDQID